MKKRLFMQTAAALALIGSASLAQAQATTPIKFQLDWRFEGPAALFLQPVAKGYFKAAGLDVTVDAGNGSGGAVQRVASGTYDMGFADLAAVMEFHANNPDAPNKPVASFLYSGPTGVGKTELARQLANTMGVAFHRFDMSEYQERHAASRRRGEV